MRATRFLHPWQMFNESQFIKLLAEQLGWGTSQEANAASLEIQHCQAPLWPGKIFCWILQHSPWEAYEYQSPYLILFWAISYDWKDGQVPSPTTIHKIEHKCLAFKTKCARHVKPMQHLSLLLHPSPLSLPSHYCFAKYWVQWYSKPCHLSWRIETVCREFGAQSHSPWSPYWCDSSHKCAQQAIASCVNTRRLHESFWTADLRH